MGAVWEAMHIVGQSLPESEGDSVLPFLDSWLQVAEDEVHYVQKIVPDSVFLRAQQCLRTRGWRQDNMSSQRFVRVCY